MGTSASKQASTKKDLSEKNTQTNAPTTPILTQKILKSLQESDPRSPSTDFARTPIQTILKSIDLNKSITYEICGTPTTTKVLDIDPRSPTTEFSRTPIVIKGDEEPNKTTSMTLHNKNLDNVRKSIVKRASISSTPKQNSPIMTKVYETKRHSIAGLLETNLDCIETDLDKVMFRTPVKFASSNRASINALKEKFFENSFENKADPRSPTTDFLRTPIEIPKRMNVSIKEDFKECISNAETTDTKEDNTEHNLNNSKDIEIVENVENQINTEAVDDDIINSNDNLNLTYDINSANEEAISDKDNSDQEPASQKEIVNEKDVSDEAFNGDGALNEEAIVCEDLNVNKKSTKPEKLSVIEHERSNENTKLNNLTNTDINNTKPEQENLTVKSEEQKNLSVKSEEIEQNIKSFIPRSRSFRNSIKRNSQIIEVQSTDSSDKADGKSSTGSSSSKIDDYKISPSDILKSIKDFDKKLNNLIYEDDNVDVIPNSFTNNKKTPLALRNGNGLSNKKTSKLRVNDKPTKNTNPSSRIPIFKEKMIKGKLEPCENTPPRNNFLMSKMEKIKKPQWDADNTLII